MRQNPCLNTIRTNLFYGLLDYTKSFPDFSIPQRFSLASPKDEKELLENISASLSGEKEILLYIHLPFCSSECVFCNSSPQRASQGVQEEYVNCLVAEIDIYSKRGIFDRKMVKCIYFGGGTPTIFANKDLERILSKLAISTNLSEDCNITCEAHPKNLMKNDRIEALLGLGIRRISMGCQTFDAQVLEVCNRSNPESQVREVILKARRLGLSVNVDMMIGLPGQTLESVRRDLAILSDLAPDSIEYMRHEIVNPLAIALYCRDPGLLVENDELFWMAYHTQEWMEEKGYEQNGRFGSERQFPYRYYWLQEMPFIALGSRSRSYTKTICYDKHQDLSLYLQLARKGVAPIARHMVLNKKEQMYRSLFLNIQLQKGLDLRVFNSRFGEDAARVFGPLLGQLTEYGCIASDSSSISLTKYGSYFIEDVCCFIIDHAVKNSGYHTQFKRMPHSSGDLLNTLSSRQSISRNA